MPGLIAPQLILRGSSAMHNQQHQTISRAPSTRSTAKAARTQLHICKVTSVAAISKICTATNQNAKTRRQQLRSHLPMHQHHKEHMYPLLFPFPSIRLPASARHPCMSFSTPLDLSHYVWSYHIITTLLPPLSRSNLCMPCHPISLTSVYESPSTVLSLNSSIGTGFFRRYVLMAFFSPLPLPLPLPNTV